MTITFHDIVSLAAYVSGGMAVYIFWCWARETFGAPETYDLWDDILKDHSSKSVLHLPEDVSYIPIRRRITCCEGCGASGRGACEYCGRDRE